MWKKISEKDSHKDWFLDLKGLLKSFCVFGTSAYKLKLLDRLKLYPTFHVSLLKKFHVDNDMNKDQRKRAPLQVRK